ncbi:hypothetical protein R6Q57_023686 [Mikania cordata]
MWRDLRTAWNTKEWLKRSVSGTNNCASSDNNGITSRHTGRSIGFDEHRINMEAYLSAMIEMYGPGFTHDNVDVWERVQAKDSTSRHTSRRVQDLESQLQDLGSQLEMERKLREESEQRIEQRLREQNEIAQEKLEKQMQEFITKFIASSNH